MALRRVIDPELGINIVDLGMLRDVEVDTRGGAVVVYMTLTTMSCPLWELFVDQVNLALSRVRGIDSVEVKFVAEPPWTPDDMTAEAREELEAVGMRLAGPRQVLTQPRGLRSLPVLPTKKEEILRRRKF